MKKQFVTSMFATKEDLYKAKAEYYEKLCEELEGDAKCFRWLSKNLDVEYGVRYDEDGPEVEVFRVTGPINDREWEKLSIGQTLFKAVKAAMNKESK